MSTSTIERKAGAEKVCVLVYGTCTVAARTKAELDRLAAGLTEESSLRAAIPSTPVPIYPVEHYDLENRQKTRLQVDREPLLWLMEISFPATGSRVASGHFDLSKVRNQVAGWAATVDCYLLATPAARPFLADSLQLRVAHELCDRPLCRACEYSRYRAKLASVDLKLSYSTSKLDDFIQRQDRAQ